MFINYKILLLNDALMQDMVPGLAIEEFSTPPSSPVMATRARRKTELPTTDSEPATDSSNDLYDNTTIQLGE
jgi:hypothetical protein